MASWRTIRIRSDLYWSLERLARKQSRSVARQADFLLKQALDREPNTSASSGGGSTSLESIPGESGRGVQEADEGRHRPDAGSLPLAERTSASDRAPAREALAQPGDVGFSPRQDEIDLYAGAGSELLKRQITVDEAIRRCPVCNDSLDDERRCVDPVCSSHRAAS